MIRNRINSQQNDFEINCLNYKQIEKRLTEFKNDNINYSKCNIIDERGIEKEKLYHTVSGPRINPTQSFIQNINQNKENQARIIEKFRNTIYKRQYPQPQSQNKIQNLPIPNELKNCRVYNDIINSDCNISLNRQIFQREYEKLSSTTTYTFPNYNTNLQFSILDSIVTTFIRNNNDDQFQLTCIGGDIEMWLIKSINRVQIKNKIFSEDTFTVIPNTTIFNFIKNENNNNNNSSILLGCGNNENMRGRKIKFLYFPLTIHWIAVNDVNDKNRKIDQLLMRDQEHPNCNVRGRGQNICDGNHAMGVLVNLEDMTISVHEPNSIRVGWYIPVSQHIEKLFINLQHLNPHLFATTANNNDNNNIQFRLQDTGAFEEGLQAIGKLPQCSFFSSLFILIQIQCNNLKADTIVNSLKQYGQNFMELLLRQYTCWLYHYAQTFGILAASNRLPLEWSKILNILNNYQYYRIPINKLQEFYSQLNVIVQVARFDIVVALKMILDLENNINVKNNNNFYIKSKK
jgi:hypothetical protein